LCGQQHVVGDGQIVEQVEELEDHADVPVPEAGQTGLTEGVDALPGHHDRAAGRPVQAGDQVEQGRLAAARRAHHGDRLARREFQADLVDRGRPVAVVAFAGIAEFYECVHPGTVGGVA
jgi:hypothetical protein